MWAALMNQVLPRAAGDLWASLENMFSIPISGMSKLAFLFSNSDLSLGKSLRTAALTLSFTGLPYMRLNILLQPENSLRQSLRCLQ